MALFKTYRGNRANLPSTKKDGNAYFCIDTGEFFIDYTDASGNLQRKQLNANDAKTVNGHTVEIDVPSDAKLTDTIITVDNVLSSTSTNPVQNKIINTKFDSIQADIDSKVDSVDGKGLSTNDLTATLKSNYDAAYTHSQQAHASADAEKNVIVGIQKNGTDLTVNSSTRKVNITVPTKTSELTNDSNFATTTALNAKVDKVDGKGLSTNDYTTAEKEKLAGIETGATKTVIDTALSSTSTNPVQNKAIYTKFTSVQSDIDSKVPSSRTINGKALTSNITLSASDVGALPSNTAIPSIDGLATETYVDNKVAGIVDSAPATLDTLNELAAALGDDPNFATTVATQIGTKVNKVEGKGLSTNDYTTTEKTKLSGIAEGAEVNQNAFSNVVVGSVTVAADNKTDTLTLVAGDNVTLTPDATNDKITIASKDTVYTHPSYTSKSSGLYKITVDGTGHVSGTTAVVKSDITGLGIPAQDTTYSEATTSAAGLMSASDKAKLGEIGDWTRVETKPTYTASEVGLGNVDNVKQYSASNPPPYPVTSVNGQTGDVTLTIDPPTDMITVSGGGNAVMGSSLGVAPYVIEFTEDETTVNYVEAPATALVGQIIKVKRVDETGSPIEWEAADMPSEVPVVTTTGDGAAYVATVPDIDTLTAGVSFVMIPHVVSTSTTPTLNVNGLGAKTIRRRLSAIATGVQSGYTASWLAVNIPYRVVYDGTFWIVEGNTKPSASDLYGAVPVDKGGVATGGATGQILAKKSGTDYDVEWITPIDVYSKTEVDTIVGNLNQAADNITAGTFAGQVVANSSAQAPGTSLLRNSKLVNADTTPTVNGEIFWTYG